MEVFDFVSDEEDNFSYGRPPILSPQVEIIENEGLGNSILDFQFGDPEDPDLWAHPSDSNSTKSSTPSLPKSQRRSHKPKSSELSSILKKPTKRTSFTYSQYEALFATWEVTECPSAEEILELVYTTGLTLRQVRCWFYNRKRLTRHGRNNRHKVTRNQVHSSFNETESSSSRSTNETPKPKLTKLEKREMRLRNIKRIPHSQLEECLETSRARISQLILLYMKKKLDMRRTLLRETNKLKETITINPFSEIQLSAMRLWRDDFFAEVCEHLNEAKTQKMSYLKSNVIEVWHSVVIYGKLNKVSLETAIEDTRSQRGEETIADSEELTVPGILRYMESHFQ